MVHVSDWVPTLLHFANYNLTGLPETLKGIDHYEDLVNPTPPAKSKRKEILYHANLAYRFEDVCNEIKNE